MILHLLYSPRAEGCPRLALELLVQERAQDGSQGEVAFCEAAPADLMERFRQSASACHFLGWQRRRYLAFFLKFLRLLRSRRPSGVICYTVGLHVPAAFAAWLVGIPVVLHLGNTPPGDRKALWKIRLQMMAARPFVKAYAACSSAVATEAVGQYALSRDKVRVVPNGIDLARFVAIRSSRPAARVSGPLVVGMVGSLEPHKDHASLLHGFKQMLAGRSDCVLVLVGDGSLRARLQARARELGIEGAVRWAGSVTDVASELAKLDVFAFSTTPSEGMGIAVVEALAAGLPVVASDIGGVREVLDGGKWGILVKGGGPQDWATALGRYREARIPPPDALQRYDIGETFRVYGRLLRGGAP